MTLPAGADFTPLFAGLPGDRCDCPHWGYVVEGSITSATPTAPRR